MCDTQHNNTSSSSKEERLRIQNRIDACISSLITPIEESKHIYSNLTNSTNNSFATILKRKIEKTTDIPLTDLRSRKAVKLTTTKYFPINIATLNVRGFNDPMKQLQILNYAKLMHLDIVGFSELHVNDSNFKKQSRFTTDQNYEFLWALNDDNLDLASGCALAIKKDLAKHIQKKSTYKGRLIVVDFYFKRFNRIRLIHIYVLPTKQIQRKKELANELQKYLRDGYQRNFKLIVLGDFNENMDQFIEFKANGRSTNSHIFRFLNMLNHYRLFNSLETHLQAPYPMTWKNNTTGSRIDGIYITETLLNESVTASVEDSTIPNISNHACVITKLNQGLFFKLD
jgi:exonuclease III